MKKTSFCTLFLLLFAFFLPLSIQANSAEPPGLVIIVNNPPDDLTLSLQFDDAEAELVSERKAWEGYYQFYYHKVGNDLTDIDFSHAKLIVSSAEFNFNCDLPDTVFHRYNNLVTLDLKTQTIQEGKSKLRTALLVILRVSLTLVIEGIVFYLFGYRKLKSWITFFVINLLTQGFVNVSLSTSMINDHIIITYQMLEFLVLVLEMIPFMIIINEHRRRRTFGYVVSANLMSLVFGALILMFLPI